jgi:hypothetical protein
MAVAYDGRFSFCLKVVSRTLIIPTPFYTGIYGLETLDFTRKFFKMIAGIYIILLHGTLISISNLGGWFHIGNEMNGYFPVIDFWKGNNVVSLKSIDPRLYSGNGATNKLLKYLEDLEETRFIVSDFGGVNAVELTNLNKTLDVRVPAGTSNLIDVSYLNGFANNVKIVLKEF